MHNTLLAAAALAITLAAAGPASAVVTFDKASFYAKAHAHAVGLPAEGTTTVTALPAAPITQTRYSNASAHGSSARTITSAAFTDMANGEVTFDDVRASTHWEEEYPPSASNVIDLTYTFTVDRSYLLRLTYDLEIADHMSVLYALSPGPGYSSSFVNLENFDTGSGVLFSNAFGPGTYVLSIEASSFVTSSPTIEAQKTSLAGFIGFTLIPNARGPASPTPEPSTWAMMLAGFSLAGFALRRRRTHVRLV